MSERIRVDSIYNSTNGAMGRVSFCSSLGVLGSEKWRKMCVVQRWVEIVESRAVGNGKDEN